MPEQTSVTKPLLYGGVSTQARHLRHPSQVEAATNIDFSLAFGAMSRPGTKLVANLGTARVTVTGVGGGGPWAVGQIMSRASGSPAFTARVIAVDGNHMTLQVLTGTLAAVAVNSNGSGTPTATIQTIWCQWQSADQVRLQPIFRSDSEIYLMVHGPSDYPRVIPVSPTLAKEAVLVDGSGGSHLTRTYLQSGSPTAADYRYCTLGDVTYIGNTKIRMAGINNNGVGFGGTGHKGVLIGSNMPNKMVRTSTSPLTFTFNEETWVNRSIAPANDRGDYDQNPLPAIFGGFPYTIAPTTSSFGEFLSDIGIYKSRLYIAGGPYIAFSQINDPTDFWIDTPGAIVDSDPVLRSLSESAVASIDRVRALRNALVCTSGGPQQFEISAAGDTFSPSTATATLSTSLNTISGVEIPRFQTGVLLPAQTRQSSHIHYYAYDDTQIAYTTTSFTSHVEGYIPPTVRRLVADTGAGFIGVVTDGSNRNLYVMRVGYQGNQLMQTAWTKWQFSGANDTLLDVAIVNGVLYVLMKQSGGGFVIEGFPLGTMLGDNEADIATGAAYNGLTGESGEPVA